MTQATNILTAWRRAVQAHLDEHLQGGSFEVVAGERDGAADRRVATVFAPPVRAEGGNVNFARPILLVRCWLPKGKQPATSDPRDPEPIEQLMIDVAETLQAIQVLPDLAGDGLFFHVTQIEPDYEDWGVQATLEGWTRNPATVP